MRKKIAFILLLCLACFYTMCQETLDFNTLSKTKTNRIKQIDSVKFQQTQCIAVYPAYGIIKSHMPSRYDLLDYLKKNNLKLYKQFKQIDSTCQLYQKSKNNMVLFDLYKQALPKSFDYEKEQTVNCNLLILTIYGENRKETLRFITSMKQSEKSN